MYTDEEKDKLKKTDGALKPKDKNKRTIITKKEKEVVDEDTMFKSVDEVSKRLSELYNLKTKEKIEYSKINTELNQMPL